MIKKQTPMVNPIGIMQGRLLSQLTNGYKDSQ